MILKYNIDIKFDIIAQRFQGLINQIYKLLPTRQQGGDWKKSLQTILQELAGMQNILKCGDQQIFFILLNKLEGLFSLQTDESFFCYRRVIFECLNLMGTIKNKCLQNY